MIDLTTAAVVYCLLVAGFFLAMWIYYDRRDHARFEDEKRKTTFHCVCCDHVYSAAGKVDESPCPDCSHLNGRLRF